MSKFAEATKQAFSFLQNDWGFRLTQSGPDLVKYETDVAFIIISRDPRLGELNVSVGLRSNKRQFQEDFHLAELLAMQGIDLPERSQPFQVYDESKITPFIDNLAEYTAIHAQHALVGDRMFFRRLKAFRTAQSEALMRDMKLREVRSKAEMAWQKRELNDVVSLYSSVEADLTEAERRKLDYARKYAESA